MTQSPNQTQLLLSDIPTEAYVVDDSADFNQDMVADLASPAGGGEENAQHSKGGCVNTQDTDQSSDTHPPLGSSAASPPPPAGEAKTNYAALIETATPAMKQYFKAKIEHPDSLLFYRMGDFYEMFFDDALEAAEILEIALTRRGKQGDQDIPMCGVPVHAYENYAEKLIRAGKRVAVCEQMESPAEAKKRGYKSIVHREVVRILTPGTITEEALLDAGASNYLASIAHISHVANLAKSAKHLAKSANMASGDSVANLANLAKQGEDFAVAWLDCSTGEVMVNRCQGAELPAALSRVNPKELIFSDGMKKTPSGEAIAREYLDISVVKPDHLFEPARARRRIEESYKLANLAPLEGMSEAEFSALGALLEYVAITQKNAMPRLDMPRRVLSGQVMQLDQSTQRNLELVVRQNGEKKLSLLRSIDHTQTASGSRLLAAWLVAPLTDVAAIGGRQDVVELLVNQADLRKACRTILVGAMDSERALSRLTMDRASPRDLLAVKHNLMASREVNGAFEQANLKTPPTRLAELWQACRGHDEMIERLQVAIKPDAAGLLRDGNFIQPGFHAALDEHRRLKENGRQEVAKLEQAYKAETGINTLKIKFNHVLGYFVEITALHQSKITERFIHRQSLANCLRYTTTELSELEQNIASAGDRALKLELELFETLKKQVLESEAAIIQAARALAEVDVFAALAELAVQHRYARPVVDDSEHFEITKGRHPVVEKSLARQGEQFAPNDCVMGADQHVWLLTGPNMAGKSTYLRQNALIAILAQMGSFVPAEAAHIGVIDKLFSRVGASDDLARGQSTFMVEMAETAAILSQATKRSFVILDEIGRGTATYDGLSIAWAVVEHMHSHIQCRTLFATHYHELTSLHGELENLACYHMRVKQWQDQLVFMHQVAEGNAEGSYGVHVAKLAGLPAEVITRAAHLLRGFDAKPKLTAPSGNVAVSAPESTSPLAEKLASIDPNNLSPREALDMLFELKTLA